MTDTQQSSPPLPLGTAATLACVWEATAAKPGNVHRGADFEDTSYVDFLTAAAIAGPLIAQSGERGVGHAVLQAVEATQLAVGCNTSLGMLLLMAPLAACGDTITPESLATVLQNLDDDDTQKVYTAIRLANPGGLGDVDQADVRSNPPAGLTLVGAMQLAAERDLVARQYTNSFADVFTLATELRNQLAAKHPVGEVIVIAFLSQLSKHPDSLIARKCGHEVAVNISRQAGAVLAASDKSSHLAALADFDFYLRADGNRRNPGTTADLVAAALFVVLATGTLPWPLKFYP